ncbi:MAG: GNAT family N-acetyltransferase [Victivallales bacterium]|nr:GNAT family N-acetyltransferase [Victivallales bacterium]
MTSGQVTIRAALESDIMAIHDLLAEYARRQLLLGRTPEDLHYHRGNFVVAEEDGVVIGCGALRDFGSNLYEVRSLAVAPTHVGKRIGSQLVTQLVERARSQRPCRVFALTYHPQLFIRLGFHRVSKELFPPKIWCDCNRCPKKDHCDEDAILMEIE